MFTGIVETVGRIINVDSDNRGKHFFIEPLLTFENIKIGESIAVNGICLTVTHVTKTSFQVTAVVETLRLTNLFYLKINDSVNLERSLIYGNRIGGHFVQGHVDGMGQILSLDYDKFVTNDKVIGSTALLVKISFPPSLADFIVNKGYITLDGMSITVIDVTATWFTVTFIPHTEAFTIVNQYQIDSRINIEVDMMGKYIKKIIEKYQHASTF